MVDFSFQNRVQETIKRVDDILDLKVNFFIHFYKFMLFQIDSEAKKN